MGVLGLWKLIESSGKPVPLETLENKVLAVDISIWLHQVVKGYQDGKGGHVQNAHLIGLFNRICKLLYFRIKPVFVFDGSVCELKRQTIAKRAKNKSKIQSDAERIEALLLENLAKEHLIKQALGAEAKAITLSPSKVKEKSRNEEKDEMFKLPVLEDEKLMRVKEEGEMICPKKSYNVNISKIDLNSSYFKSLPADIRHDILTDIKETRKQNSWAKLRELPVESKDFSGYQMAGLLRRRQVQVNIESAEKEMGGKVWSLAELESLLTEDGVLEESSKHAQRIANDENTRFVLVRDIAKAMQEAKEAEILAQREPQPSTSKRIDREEDFGDEYDLELQRAIQMSLGNDVNDEEIKVEENSAPIKLNAEQRKVFGSSVHGLVRGYMMEYAELNDDDIQDMLAQAPNENNSLNDSLHAKFPNTDPYVLYGTQENSKETIEIPSESEDDEKKSELVITVDSNSYKKEEDIFADIFSAKLKRPQTPDVEIASISSSDDDTEEYEIPNDLLEKTKDMHKEVEEDDKLSCSLISETDESIVATEGNQIVQEAVRESPPINLTESTQKVDVEVCSENEKFWKNLDDEPESINNLDEQEEIEKINKDLSENEKFWSEVLDDDKEQAQNEQLKVTNGEIKVTLSPSKSLVTKEEVSKAVDELKKVKTDVQLKHMKEELQQQQVAFEKEKNKLNRQGMSITQQMSNDCKELLKLFGIPYIQSPMEAEAQCAFLNSLKITDGTISDDSDIWLFGAQTVYKNFFVQKKMVMEYRMENIEQMMCLDRKKLIQLAMLVGSDYTVGLSGVGAVTALEILAAFPTTPEEESSTDQYQSMLSSLRKFREWFQNGKQAGTNGKTVLKSKLKNVELFEGFPSMNVLRAYLEPVIDNSTEPFSWGQLDVESLIELARTKLGWTRMKTEEILNPVVKRLNEKKQATIKDYFQIQMKKAVFDNQKLSKRVQKAVGRMAGENNDEEVEAKKTRKRSAPKKKPKQEVPTFTLSESDDEEPPEKKSPVSHDVPKETVKASRKRKPKGEAAVPVEVKRKVKSKDEPSTSTATTDEDLLLFKKSPRIPETKQVIPQRERDKIEAETNKQKAVEIFKNTKKSSKKK